MASLVEQRSLGVAGVKDVVSVVSVASSLVSETAVRWLIPLQIPDVVICGAFLPTCVNTGSKLSCRFY